MSDLHALPDDLPPALVFTDAAARKVGSLIEAEGNPELFLRVAVRPGGCSGFSYEITPKTSFDFSISNDFGTSPQGQQQKNFTIGGTLSSQLSQEWSLNGGLNYRATDYGTRTDDYVEITLGAVYTISSNVRLIGGYTYRSYSSDLVASEFSNNVFSVSANFRY